jgi:hypothetical protein
MPRAGKIRFHVKRIIFCLGHLALPLAAFRWTHSTFGFLVSGLGLSLLLDRYFTQLLPWTRPIDRRKEIGVRSAYVLFGGVGFYCMRPGIVQRDD